MVIGRGDDDDGDDEVISGDVDVVAKREVEVVGCADVVVDVVVDELVVVMGIVFDLVRAFFVFVLVFGGGMRVTVNDFDLVKKFPS